MDRSGLRIRGDRGHPEVRAALVRYACWLRDNHDFPIRVPVYLSPKKEITTIHGEVGFAAFFAPWSREEEPYIRIATGDYPSIKRVHGRKNAVAAFIQDLSHEVIHYQQWIESGAVWERGVNVKARSMLYAYARTVDRI